MTRWTVAALDCITSSTDKTKPPSTCTFVFISFQSPPLYRIISPKFKRARRIQVPVFIGSNTSFQTTTTTAIPWIVVEAPIAAHHPVVITASTVNTVTSSKRTRSTTPKQR